MNIVVATAVATVCTGAWYLAVNKPRSRFIGFSFTDLLVARIQAYKSFYADYDAERDFQRMKVWRMLVVVLVVVLVMLVENIIFPNLFPAT